MSTVARLDRLLSLVLPGLFAAGARFERDTRLRELYPSYLVVLHQVIRASVPLMQAAAARARELPDDPVSGPLAEYLDHHVDEERGHDDWLLEDLSAVGVDRDQVLARAPSPVVAELVGAQYYWMFHWHPVALLGYIFVLEGNPPSAEKIEQMIAVTGYPRSAFRTLRVHANLDPHHRSELRRMIDGLPLTGEQVVTLGTSALHTAQLCQDLMESLLSTPVPERHPSPMHTAPS